MPVIITRNVQGLVFQDEYARNADPIGNGWTEFAQPATISCFLGSGDGYVQKNATANTGAWQRNDLTIPDEGMVHTILFIQDGTAGNQKSQRVGQAVFGNNMYDATLDHAGVQQYLLRVYDGVGLRVQEVIAAGPDANLQYWPIRMVWRRVGTDRFLRLWSLEQLLTLNAARTTPLIARGNGITDAAPGVLDFTAPQNFWSETLFRESRDYWDFMCGVDIVVTGIAAGWRVFLDSDGPYVATGPTLTIATDGLVQNWTTISIEDPTGSPQANLSPTPAIFGGDQFALSGVAQPVEAGRGSRTFGGDLVADTLTVNQIARMISGVGSPEGVVPAPVGSTYQRVDGGPWLYVKESGGTGNTGWVAEIP